MGEALQTRNIYNPTTVLDCKKPCLVYEYMENSPRCLACDDRKECISLKLRWERKIKEHFLSQRTVTRVSVKVIGHKKEVVVKKGKSKEELLEEIKSLDELKF